MRALRTHRRITSWIAALALLLASFAPSLSQALGLAPGSSWIEVCTARGSQWIPAGEQGSERGPAAAHALDHCPACSLHAPAPGLPPPAPHALVPQRLTHERPLVFRSARRTLPAWVGAQPRAPPQFA